MGAGSYEIRSSFKFLHLLTDGFIKLLQAKLFTRRSFFGDFQKRVFVEHLLDFLAQLQRGELQQANGLLQLWRERQVLRNPER